MKIILEGADGTGKTTLAKLLADRYGLDICHCTQHDPGDYNFYRQSLRKENVVWDRHTLGELIYPHVFGRKPQIGTEDARIVMHYAKQEGVKVFVLTADEDTVRSRLSKRGNEDDRVMSQWKDIDEAFRFYAEQFFVPIIDTSKMTLQEIFNLIEGKEVA